VYTCIDSAFFFSLENTASPLCTCVLIYVSIAITAGMKVRVYSEKYDTLMT